MRCQMQQLCFAQFIRMDGTDCKNSLGERTSFVKDHRLYFRQGFQIVRTLYQHPLTTGTTDTGKEAKRNTDHERTWAADNQKGQSAVNPHSPLRSHAHTKDTDQRRQYSQS